MLAQSLQNLIVVIVKDKEFDKIIKKYLAQIIEIEKNPDIPQDMKQKQIRDIKKMMEKIMKSLEHDR